MTTAELLRMPDPTGPWRCRWPAACQVEDRVRVHRHANGALLAGLAGPGNGDPQDVEMMTGAEWRREKGS